MSQLPPSVHQKSVEHLRCQQARTLWSARNGTSALLADLLGSSFICMSTVHVDRLWRLGYITIKRVCLDEFALSPIPLGQYFSGRSTAQDAWMNQSSEADMRDVARRAVDAREIPNCLGRLGIDLI